MLRTLVDDHKFLVLDGALGTRIEQLGFELDPVLWSAGNLIRNPNLIMDIHKDYLNAGANIITTSSYQISYDGLLKVMNYNVQETDNLLLKSVELANRARNIVNKDYNQLANLTPRLIAASIGCYGASLANGSEYTGKYDKSEQQLIEFHCNKFRTLASSPHTDLIAFETLPCFNEVKAVTSLVANHRSEVTCWLSLACQSDSQLNSSDRIEDCIRYVEDAASEVEMFTEDTGLIASSTDNMSGGVDSESDGTTSASTVVTAENNLINNTNLSNLILGVNCTHPQHVENILQTITDFCKKDRILIAYPNRGDVWDSNSYSYCLNSGCSNPQFAELAVKWYDAGARIIGGCCMTEPSTIVAVRERLRERVGATGGGSNKI